MKRTLRPRRRCAGQALVETAIAIPILMLVVIALIEGAGYVFALGALQNAAQEGGRLAALPDTASETAVKDRVLDRADPLDLDPDDISISVNDGSRTFVLRDTGDRVRVSVAHDYRPLTAAVFDGWTFEISVQAEYWVE